MRNHVIIEVYVCVQRLLKKQILWPLFIYKIDMSLDVSRFCARLWTVLKHMSSSKCVINAGVPHNFLSNILCDEWENNAR